MPEQPKAYTVSAITRLIKDTLQQSFSGIWVEGEISGYLHHSSGHRYLNLKDENAVIKLTIWRSIGARLQFEPENGQHVFAFGDIAVYEKGGQYQLNVRKLVPVGVGALELAFRQLHEKLSKEGLFDVDRKQELPRYPSKIGIVTSPTGAAIRDIIQISRRRNPLVELVIYPAAVQGDGAEHTIAAGIDYFNTRDDIDIIVTGRGGGSLEDLWPFNTEVVVRAIDRSRIPVVSAVGHEIDTTLSDLAADFRAPTPSAAAEITVWSRRELLEQVASYAQRLTDVMDGVVQDERLTLKRLLSRPVYQRPYDTLRQYQQHVDQLRYLLIARGKNRFDMYRNRLSLVLSKLEGLSPLKILSRGYSVSRMAANRQVIRSIAHVHPGDRIETLLHDGHVISTVKTAVREKGHAHE